VEAKYSQRGEGLRTLVPRQPGMPGAQTAWCAVTVEMGRCQSKRARWGVEKVGARSLSMGYHLAFGRMLNRQGRARRGAGKDEGKKQRVLKV
jgi:hypothetical protein